LCGWWSFRQIELLRDEVEVWQDCLWTNIHVLYFYFNRSKPLIRSDGKI
jgi:hypothetical protein